MQRAKFPYQIIAQLSDPIVVLDQNGIVIYSNKRFKKFFDNSSEDKITFREIQHLNRAFGRSGRLSTLERISVSATGKRFDILFYSFKKLGMEQNYNLAVVKTEEHEGKSEIPVVEALMQASIKGQLALSKGLAPAFKQLVGEDFGFRLALVNAQKAAKTDLPILIIGESGTGKEILARSIHKFSNRRSQPFVDVNCAAIPDNLIESELFGYERGAFTGARMEGKRGLFQEADQGTIFLDEVGDTALSAQSKLLRVLQEGRFKRVGGTKNIKVDVRVISATNRELESMMREKNFRDDLYYRLNTICVPLPPLRDRGDDIRLIAELFLQEHARKANEQLFFSKKTLKLLGSYSWPGNIRELKSVVDYAATMSENKEIGVESLPPSLFLERAASLDDQKLRKQFNSVDPQTRLLPSVIQKVEKDLIQMAIKQSSSRSQAIKILGISRRTFYKKLKQYNLSSKFE